MKYRIAEHLIFTLRKPCRRKAGTGRPLMDYETADERKDRGGSLRVNVLMMAKGKKKNDTRVTAGDLFGKLGRKQEKVSPTGKDEEEFLEEKTYPMQEEDAIDVSSSAEQEQSDSDLDINELLRKYMPEYKEEGDSAEDVSGGVLSKLKKTASEERETGEPVPAEPSSASAASAAEDNQEAKLIDALDSVFSVPDAMTSAAGEPVPEEGTSAAPASPRQKRQYRVVSIAKKSARPAAAERPALPPESEETIHEYDLQAAEEEPAPSGEPIAAAETEKPRKKGFGLFGALLGRTPKAETPAEVPEERVPAEVPAEPAPEEKTVPPAEITETVSSDKPLTDEEWMEQAAQALAAAEPDEAPAEKPQEPAKSAEPAELTEFTEPAESAELTEAAESTEPAESAADPEEAAAKEEEDFDPTDINLMVAFGLDAGSGSNAKAKELGDRLEAKQAGKVRKHKLDRPEFVDKSQTPKIRREFHDRAVGLWIRLGLCAVFTLLLLLFENVSVLTRLFTGTSKQFAGILDPAVYPVVYIMVSLQLMLLACVCAYDQIVDGFRFLFRGTPRPETMTALLTVAGIVYSVVLCRVIRVPQEPVMFNFVVALSALFTLIYALYNNKRENMNFRVIANKRPKHIVRRLLDEESECEAKAFSDTEDVCDVMKIEKTDFVDGFFARLSAPDSTTGIFMTFVMSACAALAVLFGLFVHFRGGDAAMVTRVVYGSLLILTPLTVYMTFSYPFYRANVAAKEYDSAIIGETSLEEYSNASVVSFDDKNVFPSYSVKVQNIRIYNNARIDRVLYYAASVFAYAGGPLQDVFEVATKDMGTSEHVQIFDTEAGFLATQVDGVNIIFGSCEALRRRGLDIPDSAAEDDVDLSDELEIMYMFRESKLVAKMYIKYVMDADIDLILKQFSGMYACVRTYDPNIDERMIAKKLNMKRIPLKIVRYASTDEVGMYEEKVDSGLVTCGTPKSLLQVISYCGKVLHTKKTNIALSVLSIMIGAAILLLLLLSDSLGTLNSLFIALYQLVWLIPMLISSKMFIR